jgi:hypothetical protein
MNGSLWGSEETFRLLGIENGHAASSLERFLAAVYPPDREKVESTMGFKQMTKHFP